MLFLYKSGQSFSHLWRMPGLHPSKVQFLCRPCKMTLHHGLKLSILQRTKLGLSPPCAAAIYKSLAMSESACTNMTADYCWFLYSFEPVAPDFTAAGPFFPDINPFLAISSSTLSYLPLHLSDHLPALSFLLFRHSFPFRTLYTNLPFRGVLCIALSILFFLPPTTSTSMPLHFLLSDFDLI
ncbi:hypothetical protein BDV06DRAFT_9621 [Aspergillus oleicola]